LRHLAFLRAFEESKKQHVHFGLVENQSRTINHERFLSDKSIIGFVQLRCMGLKISHDNPAQALVFPISIVKSV
jgi:hypothetical protein